MKYIYPLIIAILMVSLITTNINYYRYLIHTPKNKVYTTMTNFAKKIPCCKEVGYITDTNDPNVYFILQYLLAPQIVHNGVITSLTVANLINTSNRDIYREDYAIVEVTKEISLLQRK